MGEALVHQQLCFEIGDNNVTLGYVDSGLVETWIRDHGSVYGRTSGLGDSLKGDQDLVPDVYEGEMN